MYPELQSIIDTSRRIVFFGGAGVSTESGIPDFRSVDGLYNQRHAYPPETILSATFFRRHPEEFYRFYRDKMLPLEAQPNPAHLFLAKLEVGLCPTSESDCLQSPSVASARPERVMAELEVGHRPTSESDCLQSPSVASARPERVMAESEVGRVMAGKLTAVITQNIDGLHQKAGSKNVLELHGSIHRNRCMKCAKFYPPEFIRDSQGIPRCNREVYDNNGARSVCGGVIKPEVVLYEEGLDDDVLSAAVHHIRQADTLIIAGTSLTVYPAAGLVRYFRGQHLVLINRDATPMDDEATLVIHDSVGKVFSHLKSDCT